MRLFIFIILALCSAVLVYQVSSVFLPPVMAGFLGFMTLWALNTFLRPRILRGHARLSQPVAIHDSGIEVPWKNGSTIILPWDEIVEVGAVFSEPCSCGEEKYWILISEKHKDPFTVPFDTPGTEYIKPAFRHHMQGIDLEILDNDQPAMATKRFTLWRRNK